MFRRPTDHSTNTHLTLPSPKNSNSPAGSLFGSIEAMENNVNLQTTRMIGGSQFQAKEESAGHTEKTRNINESLQFMISQYHEHEETEQRILLELKDLCAKARVLESKLSSKKALILEHFQQLVSNLDYEN
ncbi:hypothetical protein D915_005612 [Fasciola hepatica]|uniref:Uncharacterized protein n=1 Tax=Fasciola hepatica TaxID=6192 RepID=A0A2H1C9X2_FASHE|nr:hypothetical protein D915_005612 [Fasciola hepatica]